MNKNGCFNRPELDCYVTVQTGWKENWDAFDFNFATRVPIIASIPNPNSKDCQYSMRAPGVNDPKCKGCIHKYKPTTQKEQNV